MPTLTHTYTTQDAVSGYLEPERTLWDQSFHQLTAYAFFGDRIQEDIVSEHTRDFMYKARKVGSDYADPPGNESDVGITVQTSVQRKNHLQNLADKTQTTFRNNVRSQTAGGTSTLEYQMRHLANDAHDFVDGTLRGNIASRKEVGAVSGGSIATSGRSGSLLSFAGRSADKVTLASSAATFATTGAYDGSTAQTGEFIDNTPDDDRVALSMNKLLEAHSALRNRTGLSAKPAEERKRTFDHMGVAIASLPVITTTNATSLGSGILPLHRFTTMSNGAAERQELEQDVMVLKGAAGRLMILKVAEPPSTNADMDGRCVPFILEAGCTEIVYGQRPRIWPNPGAEVINRTAYLEGSYMADPIHEDMIQPIVGVK